MITLKYGIIGYPLTHSFSPTFFARKFQEEGIKASYDAFPISSIAAFPQFLAANPELAGINVTIPYKETIIPYLDIMDPVAGGIGAVNCVSIRDGITTGYNTDVIGFEESLVPLLQPQHTHALVLGNGGAAKAVKYVLQRIGVNYKSVSRVKKDDVISYDELTAEIVDQCKLIINTTPLGMFPNIESFPALPYEAIGENHLLYDLVYNPAETQFLKLGASNGAMTKNGLEMLELQALAGWGIWQNKGVTGFRL